MTYSYEIHADMDKVLKKLAKKEPVQYNAILKKIGEVIHCCDVNHYKNLRTPLQKYKRVHVYSSFVLLFSVQGSTILFRHYAHHDEIFR